MSKKYTRTTLLAIVFVLMGFFKGQAQENPEEIQRYEGYTPIAWFYNKFWSKPLADVAVQNLNKILIPKLKPGAKILDLMCGNGHVTQALKKRGYKLTGLDGSDGMLKFAQQNAPGVPFILEDARTFDMKNEFDAVICMNDGLNHILEYKELVMAARKVYASVKKGGYFVFDVNLESRYKTILNGDVKGVQDSSYAFIYNYRYNVASRLADIQFNIFIPGAPPNEGVYESWKRVDVNIAQYCYPHIKIIEALETVGFTVLKTYDGYEDLKSGGYNKGRRYYVCQKK